MTMRWLTQKERYIPLSSVSTCYLVNALIVAYPVVQSIRLSFFDISLLMPARAKFVGFRNYVEMLHRETFYRALLNSIVWIIGCVSTQFVVGMLGALLLKCKFKGEWYY